MNSCAAAGRVTARREGGQEGAEHGRFLSVHHQGRPPSRKARASGDLRGGEEGGGGAGLEQAAAVEEGHVLGQPAGLREVVGGHHHGDAVGGEALDHALDAAGGAGVELGAGLVEEEDLGAQRPGARQREALLLAAGEERAPGDRRGARGRSGRAPRRRGRCARRGGRGRGRGRARGWRGRSGAASPGAGTPSPARRAARSGSDQAMRPSVGRMRPWQSRRSRLLPAPFGPRMTRRRPACTVRSTSASRRWAPTAKPRPSMRSGRIDAGALIPSPVVPTAPARARRR